MVSSFLFAITPSSDIITAKPTIKGVMSTMIKYSTITLMALLFFSNCFADTYVNLKTGESFNGYATGFKRGDKREVNTGEKTLRYLNLDDYEVSYNYLGRKNKVYIFSVTGSIELIGEAEAFEKAVTAAANDGPLFILIEIDSPGGRIGLARRLCAAITKLDNCRTVAFVAGDKFGGAFDEGAMVALACDKVYMKKGASIGAASASKQSAGSAVEELYGQKVGEKFRAIWKQYCLAVAEGNSRPVRLVEAMLDEETAVAEVFDTGSSEVLFIDPNDKKPAQVLIHTWSQPGQLLRLTAAEAVGTGVADRAVISKEELLAGLSATKARQISDKSVAEARDEFNKARHKVDKLLASVSELEGQASDIGKKADILEAEIRRLDEIISRYRPAGGGLSVEGIKYVRLQSELQQLITYHDRLPRQLSAVLEELIGNYQEAIPAVKEHSDLGYHLQKLEQGLKSAQARYGPLRSILVDEK